MYCKCEISDDSLIDFCDRCGVGVFGEKMLETIKENMEKANNSGSLFQGSVGDFKAKDIGRFKN